MKVRMNINQRNLRRLRRKDENGHGGNGTLPVDQNNQPGNQQQNPPNNDSPQNNTGTEIDVAGFWADPQPKEGDQQQQQNQQQQESDNAKAFGQQLATDIAGIQFKPVFNDDVIQKLAEGDTSGVNEAIAAQSRQAIQQSLALNAKMMQAFGQNLLAQVRAEIGKSHVSKDDESALMAEFKSYGSDPGTQRTIRSVFDQAMKHTGGDRPKALQQTKDMLKIMGQNIGRDVGLDIPPNGREDFMGDGPNALVAELLGRS